MFSATKITREVNVDLPELIMTYFEQHPVVLGRQPTNFKIV